MPEAFVPLTDFVNESKSIPNVERSESSNLMSPVLLPDIAVTELDPALEVDNVRLVPAPTLVPSPDFTAEV